MAFLNSLLDRPDDGGWPGDPGGNLPPPPPPPPGPAGPGLPYSSDFGHNFGGGGGGGAATIGRPTFNFPGLPEFTPPEFTPPTLDEASMEPGFQFRLRSGTDALERSAAARGTLRTGGTLKDVIEYGQNFASQEYSNAYNRALSTFNTRYQGAKDRFAPQLARWQTLSQAEIAAALAQYNVQNRPSGGGGGSFIPPFLEEEDDEGDYY